MKAGSLDIMESSSSSPRSGKANLIKNIVIGLLAIGVIALGIRIATQSGGGGGEDGEDGSGARPLPPSYANERNKVQGL
jgi:hypothetical protein